MAVDADEIERIRGLESMAHQLNIIRGVLSDEDVDIVQALRDLVDHAEFWASWDAYVELEPAMDEVPVDEFLEAEMETFRRDGLSDAEIRVVVSLLGPVEGERQWQISQSADVCGAIANLADKIEEEGDEHGSAAIKRGGFLRKLGRGLLILTGAGVVGTDAAAVFANPGGVILIPSIRWGMRGIAAGAFDDPELLSG